MLHEFGFQEFLALDFPGRLPSLPVISHRARALFENHMDMRGFFTKSSLPDPAAKRGQCLEWLPDECLRAIAAASVLTFKDRLVRTGECSVRCHLSDQPRCRR